MLFRIVIVFIVATVVFVALRMLLRKKSLTVNQFMQIYLAALVGLTLLYLAVTGMLHPLFGLLGALLPFLLRMLNLISIVRMLRRFIPTMSAPRPPGQGQVSEINTRFLHMVLFHDSGMMDGEVREGKFTDSKLSLMELEQLLELLDECRVDADSLHVLEAFLDREYKTWRDNIDARSAPPGDGNGSMSEMQAYEILGLGVDATRDDVIQAHRRLMQKLHPDRGGSTYLAARINEAKSLLMAKLGKD